MACWNCEFDGFSFRDLALMISCFAEILRDLLLTHRLNRWPRPCYPIASSVTGQSKTSECGIQNFCRSFLSFPSVRSLLRFHRQSALKFLAGITSRPVPEQDILDFSVFTKNLKSTTLHNSVKPFVSPLSDFVPSDIKFGGQDWSSFSNVNSKSFFDKS